MPRKDISLTKENDVKKWKTLKMKAINKQNNPDLGDTDLLRQMMNTFEKSNQDSITKPEEGENQ